MEGGTDDTAPTGAEGAPRDLSVEQALRLALELQKRGVLEAAEELYGRILVVVPDQVDAVHFLALSRYRRGLHDEGIAGVRRALALAPEHVDARNNLGNMLLERDRINEAEEAYRQVLQAQPNHAHAHTNMGNILRRQHDDAGAEAAFRKALEIDPEHGDAYHNLGSLLQDIGRSDEALGAFQRALALRPYHGDSYRRVGATLYALGRVAEAEGVYRSWLKVEPTSPIAEHMLTACTGRGTPPRASDAFVQGTFDTFAASFDVVLERLQYRAPALVAQAVAAAIGAPAGKLDVLDVGAGTGLCGPSLRPYARRLVGIDLSAGMLDKARERGGYDALEKAELTAYMREQSAAYDLIVSADTLVYLGDLAPPLAAAARALRPGGLVVFTLEREEDETVAAAGGFRLNPHGRYGHGEAYVRSVLAEVDLVVVALERAHLRLESLVPVEGMVVSARKNMDPVRFGPPSARSACPETSRRHGSK